MRKSALALAAVAVMLVMTACGGGGGAGPPANRAPTANAGAAQTVLAGAAVLLNGTASSDSDGIVAGYAWTQTSGTGVTLNNSTSARPGFVAPSVVAAATLTFSLVVTDNSGAASTASSVTITVNPPPAGNVTVSGVVRFERVPFFNSGTFGLNYANPVLQPARGVIVRALNPALEILATGVTSATGAYSLSVAGNTSITIQVVARMQRDVSLPLPRWDVRVQNGPDFPVPYSHTTTAFNSSLGTQNIDIPTGIGPTGTAIPGSVRASGPFAILDTIYTAMQAVLAVEPAANFPALLVDWGSQSECTCFTRSSQSIALMSDLTEDTDEFDQHVVAHEFGHYIEHNFSRSDSIGGSHGLGDRLDMRLAFGEGFGYAFAAMVLNDPFARDSFVFNGSHVTGAFNVEFNPPGDGSGPGCWCSESSVWAILWDLYDDGVGETIDNVALGFEPIWDVLTGPQRSTNSLTSIFSFIHALKVAQPGSAAAIDTLVSAQNIDSATINPFASNETNEPFPDMLPIYTTITPGVPVVLRTIDDAGRYNKVGNHRFVRFVPAMSGNVTVTLFTSNPNVGDVAADPDFGVYREGTFLGYSQRPPPQPESALLSVTAGQTYIIDVYDCANGCPTEPEQGMSGDYNLTVTIN